VTLLNSNVSYSPVCQETPCELDSVLIYLCSDDLSLRANPVGKEFKATLRTTADFKHPGSSRNSDLIEKPARFVCEFPALPLQAALLDDAMT